MFQEVNLLDRVERIDVVKSHRRLTRDCCSADASVRGATSNAYSPVVSKEKMKSPDAPRSDEVENLLLNAELRDALEPLFDESIGRVNAEVMSVSSENDFLQSMLEWERAPIVPIRDWFSPPLEFGGWWRAE